MPEQFSFLFEDRPRSILIWIPAMPCFLNYQKGKRETGNPSRNATDLQSRFPWSNSSKTTLLKGAFSLPAYLTHPKCGNASSHYLSWFNSYVSHGEIIFKCQKRKLQFPRLTSRSMTTHQSRGATYWNFDCYIQVICRDREALEAILEVKPNMLFGEHFIRSYVNYGSENTILVSG